MYVRYAENQGFKVELLDSTPGSSGGYSEISFMIKGDSVYSKLKYESGAHRVQRVPQTESQGRVHTSTATVLVMPEIDDVDFELDMNDVRVDITRSSGCGGQGVNTTDSAVRLTHIPTGIVVYSQTERSQIKNKEIAIKILKSRVYDLKMREQEAEVIVGPEARGFIFGCPVATNLRIGFIPVRKPNKLPRRTISVSYDLEYGKNTLSMHADSIKSGQKVVVIDDLLATGGTIKATIELIEKMGGIVVGCAFLIELKELKGRELLEEYQTISLMEF